MKLIKISLIVLLVLLIAYQAVITIRTFRNDDNAPVIRSNVNEIQISCQYTKEDLLQGLSAYDKEDGDITEKILIGAFSDFTERGVSSLEYAVYDKDDNIAVFSRKVVFSDYTSPRIKVLAPLVFKATNNSYNIPSLSQYLEGWDQFDGNITKHMLLNSTDLDFSEPGRYTLSVYLKNRFGDEVNMDLPIHILEPGKQNGYTIDITEPLIYVGMGDAFDSEEYIVSVRNEYTGEVIPAEGYELTINSDVDTSKDGIYEIQFSVISSDKTLRGETWMTVIVEDNGG